MKKAIFLDRDGTLNHDRNYVYKEQDLVLLKWVSEWLKIMKDLGFYLIIITNQSWIWRWYYSMVDCINFNKSLEHKIWIIFDEIYICPHIEENNCECRKPSIWNIIKARDKFWIILDKSFFIWDKETDIECWRKARCTTVLIKSNKNDQISKADYVVDSLYDFSKILINNF